MDFKQLRERAGQDATPLLEERSTYIRVSASPENRAADDSYERLKNWADNAPAACAIRTGGMGYVDLEPIVLVKKPGAPMILYTNVGADVAERLIEAYLDGDDPLVPRALGVLSDEDYAGIPALRKLPIFAYQRRVALRNVGLVDPNSLAHAVAAYGAYSGLDRALQLSAGQVIERVGRAGLRVRDGGGSPAAPHWSRLLAARGEKVVVLNAADGAPDARATRLLLTGDPHGVLEGLLIAAYAVGADTAIVAVPDESTVISRRLEEAVSQMKAFGLVGEDILGAGFDCRIEIRAVPVSPAVWETSAVLRRLEGRQAIPTHHEAGALLTLGGRAALVTTAETLALTATVLREDALAADTKIVTLTGDAAHTYTLEVPLGTPAGTLVREIGGCADSRAVRFGPAGRYRRADAPDALVSHEAAGETVCFETLDVFEHGRCAVEAAAETAEKLHAMSCGKCVFCREGTLHLASFLDYIVRGEGRSDDLALMAEIGRNMQAGCVCVFGRTAAGPALSSLQLFASDYEAHLNHKTCPAGLKGGASFG